MTSSSFYTEAAHIISSRNMRAGNPLQQNKDNVKNWTARNHRKTELLGGILVFQNPCCGSQTELFEIFFVQLGCLCFIENSYDFLLL
jgi:hypothetical protein